MCSVPIIHMLYFPWDRNQKLKADCDDFDHAPYETMRAYAPGMDVRLWTYPQARALCEEHYPDVWAALRTVARPVMLVDVLRWVVVHHLGGIYWQMNTTPLVPMESFLPAAGKSVRLFTEFDLSADQCRKAADEPIRQREPEESKRILIGVFAAAQGAKFVGEMIQFLTGRLRQYVPRRDYDVLFIAGNAAASTGYDRFGKNDASVEVVSLADSRRMLKLHYAGSWRTEAPAAQNGQPAAPLPPPAPFIQRKLKDLYFRHLVPHAHEELFGKQAAESGAPGNRVLDLLAPFIRENGIERVVEVTGSVVGGGELPKGVRCAGGNPARSVVAKRKQVLGASSRVLRQINLLYSELPKGDLFVCPEYLEWISFSEALRIWRRIFEAGYSFVSFSHHPLLEKNWDTACGDHRPLNFCRPPFSFGAPTAVIPWPSPTGRPDRSLALWKRPFK